MSCHVSLSFDCSLRRRAAVAALTSITMSLNGEKSRIRHLVAQINSTAEESADLENDQQTRVQLLQLSRELTKSLEAPDEACSNLAFSVSGLAGCKRGRTLIDT